MQKGVTVKSIDTLAAIFVIVGGLNWGLIGFFGFNLVDFLFGGMGFDRLVYGIVGLSALWQARMFKDFF